MTKTVFIYKKSNLIGSSGGVEKMLSWLSNELVEKGYTVHLATRDKKSGQLFYPLHDKVHFHHFRPKFSRFRRIIGQLTHGLISYFNREKYIADMIRSYCDQIKPDIIITAGIQDLADIVYHNPYPCPKIVQLHSEPSVFFTKKKKKLFIKTLKSANTVQVLLPGFIPVIKRFYTGRVVAIENAVPLNTYTTDKKPIIIYVGRVEKDKQQHLAIEAFAALSEKYGDWELHFWGSIGDKAYYDECMEMIRRHHLEKKIIFKGTTNQIPAKLAESSVCVFTSRFEGFGLGLVEAMAAQVPCIGLASCPAVNQLIEDGVNGFLVHDINEFIRALDHLLSDKNLRKFLGQAALNTSKRYVPTLIIQKWIDLIENRESKSV